MCVYVDYLRVSMESIMSDCTDEIFSQEAGLVCAKTIEIKRLKHQLKEKNDQIDNHKSLHELAKIEVKRINHRARELFKQLKDCEEALRFYASDCFVPRTKDASDWCQASDLEHIKQENGLHYDWGGKKARKYFEKYKRE